MSLISNTVLNPPTSSFWQKPVRQEKLLANHVDALKINITERAQAEISEKSTKEEREREPFSEKAKTLGFTINKEGKYQSINNPDELFTIEEMESRAYALIEKNPFNQTDVIQKHVLPNLPFKELLIVRSLNRKHANDVRQTIKNEHLNFLDKNLREKFPNVYSQLKELFSSSPNTDSADLIDLHAELHNLIEESAKILTQVPFGKLKELAQLSKEKSHLAFHKSFIIANIYKSIDIIYQPTIPLLNQFYYTNCDKHALIDTVLELYVTIGSHDKAFEFAEQVQNDVRLTALNVSSKQTYIGNIYDLMAKNGHFVQLYKLTRKFPKEKDLIISKIVFYLNDNDKYDEAINWSFSIQGTQRREESLCDCVKALVDNACAFPAGKNDKPLDISRFNRAIVLANFININESDRIEAFYLIIKSLSRFRYYDEIFKYVHELFPSIEYQEEIGNLCRDLLERNEPEHAQKLAEMIPDQDVRDSTLKRLEQLKKWRRK